MTFKVWLVLNFLLDSEAWDVRKVVGVEEIFHPRGKRTDTKDKMSDHFDMKSER